MDNESVYPIQKFLAFLEGKVKQQDRGLLADLRHGFNPDTEYRSWPHLAPYINLEDHKKRIIWQTIAAGFACLEGSANKRRFGKSLRAIALADNKSGKPDDALNTFSRQVRRLISFNTAEEVCKHLPGIIRRAKSKKKEIDFKELYWDLWNWEKTELEIKVKWVNDYWDFRNEEEQ